MSVATLEQPALGRRERKKQAVRDSILAESLALIAAHGVEGTTIEAICDAADISRKTFYNYYTAKHDLMLDLCQAILMARLEATIDDALARGDNLAACLDLIFDEIARRNGDAGRLEKGLIEFLVSNLAANPAEGAGQLTQMNRYYQRLFDRFSDELRPGLSPAFCAEMTVGMSNTVALNWLHNDDYDAGARFRQLANYLKHSMLITRPEA